MKHVVVYVPGIGDKFTLVRQMATAGWFLYGVRPVVHEMNWADKQPFEPKLQSLLQHIDALITAGHTVSLVGESAGASAAIIAYSRRQDVIHRVACICGKLKNPQTISPRTLRANPAFAEAMAQLPVSLTKLNSEHLRRIRSIHPLQDTSVPPQDTVITGAESYTIPCVDHKASIILGDTVFSYALVPFLKRA